VTHARLSATASANMANSRRFVLLRNILCGGRGPCTIVRAGDRPSTGPLTGSKGRGHGAIRHGSPRRRCPGRARARCWPCADPAPQRAQRGLSRILTPDDREATPTPRSHWAATGTRHRAYAHRRHCSLADAPRPDHPTNFGRSRRDQRIPQCATTVSNSLMRHRHLTAVRLSSSIASGEEFSPRKSWPVATKLGA
jgi:hypothetical protein